MVLLYGVVWCVWCAGMLDCNDKTSVRVIFLHFEIKCVIKASCGEGAHFSVVIRSGIIGDSNSVGRRKDKKFFEVWGIL